MATEKQLQANRANALKSTGPVSQAGKARSSKNSRRHGLLSCEILLPTEDPEEFRAFHQEFRQCCEPVGRLEEELLMLMAMDLWRLRRINQIEGSILAKNIFLEKSERAEDRASIIIDPFLIPTSPETLSNNTKHREAKKEAEKARLQASHDSTLIGDAFVRDVQTDHALGKLSRYETAIHRNFMRIMEEFTKLQALRKRQSRSSATTIDLQPHRSGRPDS